ncbi:MAG: hypothetical protein IH876_00890 [Gemmatimonadetes bacterium]|nr:hypothetical protein [Gemmatimonadota bacterium]
MGNVAFVLYVALLAQIADRSTTLTAASTLVGRILTHRTAIQHDVRTDPSAMVLRKGHLYHIGVAAGVVPQTHMRGTLP